MQESKWWKEWASEFHLLLPFPSQCLMFLVTLFHLLSLSLECSISSASISVLLELCILSNSEMHHHRESSMYPLAHPFSPSPWTMSLKKWKEKWEREREWWRILKVEGKSKKGEFWRVAWGALLRSGWDGDPEREKKMMMIWNEMRRRGGRRVDSWRESRKQVQSLNFHLFIQHQTFAFSPSPSFSLPFCFKQLEF